MKNIGIFLTAIFTAVISTSCCLPAFLFLFFGVSVGSLSFLQELNFLRIPLSIVSIVLLVFYFVKRQKAVTCECTKTVDTKKYILGILFPLIIALILFYPEFSVYFVE